MDKPMSMSVKDFLIRTLAIKMLTSENTLEAVINHQFQSANEAMHLNKSVEISGFGKFYFNDKKAVKRMEKLVLKKATYEEVLANPETTDQRRAFAVVVLETVNKSIQELKPRITYED